MHKRGSFRMLHADHLGSTVAETAGSVVEAQKYRAFGDYRATGTIADGVTQK